MATLQVSFFTFGVGSGTVASLRRMELMNDVLRKGCKIVKTGAFLFPFCINIQNVRKIANGAIFFLNV